MRPLVASRRPNDREFRCAGALLPRSSAAENHVSAYISSRSLTIAETEAIVAAAKEAGAEPIENSFGVFVNRVDVRPVHSTSKPAGLLRLAAKNFRQLHVDLADRDRLMKYPYLCL